MSPDPIGRLGDALSDRYRLERQLGQGGMATVYLAEDLKHKRRVALKVLKPELAAVLGAERFVQEITTTASLQHPNILSLFDSGTAEGFLYYVMPFIDGETLRRRLDRETQLGIEEAVKIAVAVADALDYAHRSGVIHRDIKPENILLHDGRPMVADFGIALALSAAAGGRMTETGLSLGTPHYMSPEQATAEKEISARSDIYSLGSVLYEMLTGNPPHTGASAQQIIMKIVTEDAAPVTKMRKSVPPNVAAAVAKSLEKLPADRFASAAELATALMSPTYTRHMTGIGFAASAAAGRWRRVAFAAGAVAVACAAVALWGWRAARAARRGDSATAPVTITSILPPAGGTFAERTSLALSPDGRRLAFVSAAGDGSRMLWLRHLGRAQAEPMPNTAGADAPFWSPDARSLGFFASGSLLVLDENGETRSLCPASAPMNGSWGSAGTIVFSHHAGIVKVAATGGSCDLIVPRDSAGSASVAFLPDGKRFVYSRGRLRDAIVADLDGRQLGTLPLRTVSLAFIAPDLVLGAGTSDFRALEARRIDLSSLSPVGTAMRLASNVRTAGGVHTFSIATSGDLAYLPGMGDRPYLEYGADGLLRDTVRVEGTWTIASRPRRAGPTLVALAGYQAGLWLYDLDADRATRLPVRDSLLARAPVFNLDGTRLVYAVTNYARCGIVERELASGVERTIQMDSSGTAVCPVPLDWSFDGGSLLVLRDTALRIMSLDGSNPPQDVARPGRLWEGRFSSDGHWLAFSSDETGRAEIYIQPLPTGTPVRVSVTGGRWPAWADDSRTLYFATPDGRVQTVTIGPGPGHPIGTVRTLFTVPTWRRSLFDDAGTGFAMVGNGERFLLRQSPSALGVTYLQHWPTLLRRAPDEPGRESGP